MSKLVLQNLCKQYQSPQGPVPVLTGVNLVADAGQTLAITGPSGSGKSTLLNIIGSLDYPTGGSARWDDIEINSLQGTSLCEFRARRVGFVFQDHHLLPQLTALENVLLPTLARSVRRPQLLPGGATVPDTVSEAHRLLGRMGVACRARAFPWQLSGGERQRVAIARALINGAGLLLCDEPTGNLDQDTARHIVALFVELARRDGVTVLMVTHNLELAGRLERWLELRHGELVPAAGEGQGEARGCGHEPWQQSGPLPSFPSPGTPAFGSEAQARRGEGRVRALGPHGLSPTTAKEPPPSPPPSPGVPGEGEEQNAPPPPERSATGRPSSLAPNMPAPEGPHPLQPGASGGPLGGPP